MKKVLLLLSVIFCLSSCATMFCGSKKRVVLESNIPAADKVTIDGHSYLNVTFPFNVKIKRGFSETIVKCDTKGYQPLETIIDKKFNSVTILNVAVGGIIGLGIDAATGAMMKPEYSSYNLEFVPENK